MRAQAGALRVAGQQPSGVKERPSLIVQLARHRSGRWGLLIIGAALVLAVLAPLLAPHNPYDIDQRGVRLSPPSLSAPLGTDGQGVDVLSQIIYGTRVSLTVGIVTAITIASVGALAGVAAGYMGGMVDTIIMRTADVLFSIPGLPLMILLVTYLGPSFVTIIMIFTVLGWAGLARTVRAQVLSVRTRPFVEAATVCGATSGRIMLRYVLPAVSSLVLMNTAMMAGGMMLAEAGLSFLGLGDARAVSWGKMLSQSQSGNGILLGAWWWIITPGLALFVTTLGFILIGYALEEILNPYLGIKRSGKARGVRGQ